MTMLGLHWEAKMYSDFVETRLAVREAIWVGRERVNRAIWVG